METMEWGDVPTWTGIGLSLVGAGWAGWKSWKAKASADRAEERAEQALVASQSMADSSSRMADSLGEIAQALAQGGGLPGGARATGEPAWNVEYRTGSAYVLRNVGTVTASQVTADAGASIAKNLPAGNGVTLKPGEGHEFLLIGAWGAPVPTSLVVTCAELGARHVSVPAKP